MKDRVIIAFLSGVIVTLILFGYPIIKSGGNFNQKVRIAKEELAQIVDNRALELEARVMEEDLNMADYSLEQRGLLREHLYDVENRMIEEESKRLELESQFRLHCHIGIGGRVK